MKNRRCTFFVLPACSPLLFSASAPAQNGGGLQVVKADWGAGNRWMDVTNQVRRLLNGNGLVYVNNDTMGGDPAFGVYKILRIRARILAASLSNSPTRKTTRLMPASSTTMAGQGVQDTQGIQAIHHRMPVIPAAPTALCKSRARTMA